VTSITDGRGTWVAQAARVGGTSTTQRVSPSDARAVDVRRFRVTHALRAVDDAITLLRDEDVEGVELAALGRVRDDLAVVLRLSEAQCRR
jgi:hypothetical protein